MITQRQRAKLQAVWTEKSINPVCPSCGKSRWQAGDIISPVVMNEDGSQRMGGDAIPMLQVICESCFYVRLYAAVPLGLLDKQKT